MSRFKTSAPLSDPVLWGFCKASEFPHNDYKLDNLVLDPEDPLRIIGILDWEMATIGDPLMDLGNSLAYWGQKDDPEELQAIRLMRTNIPGALARNELVARYLQKSEIAVDGFHFYYCFGLFRLTVIAQQNYYRFYHGQTKDKRFKTLIFAVNNLEKRATRVKESGSSGRLSAVRPFRAS